MACPVCDYDYLSEIQCDYCFLPQSHFEYAKDILWGGESVALRAVREKFKKISILDLTGREFLSLFKNFLKGQLVCTLILVVPYFIIVYLGLDRILSSPGPILTYAACALLLYWLIEDLEYTFKFIGDFFHSIATVIQNYGKTKVIMSVLGIVFVFYLVDYLSDTVPHLMFLFIALIVFPFLFSAMKCESILEAKAIVSEFDVVNQNSDNQTA